MPSGPPPTTHHPPATTHCSPPTAHDGSTPAAQVPHLFGADSFHLNANGHRTVFNQIWRLYRALPCAEHRDLARTEADEDIGVSCALGDELEPSVG